MANQEHIVKSLSKIQAIFEKASDKIESLKSGEKIPATALANELAAEFQLASGEPMKGPQLYPTLKFLLDNYPGVDVKRGAHGGIIKR